MSSNLVVQTNILALNSHRNLKNIGILQSQASEKLSSGYRINRAADDAAGLAISEKMRAQVRGLDQASRNTQDGISMIQTAEGGLIEIDNMIQRIRELTVQGANDSNEAEDREKITKEITQLAEEIGKTAEKVEFNKKKVLDVADAGFIFSDDMNFQVGANEDQLLAVGSHALDLAAMSSDLAALWTDSDASSDISATISDIDVHLTSVVDARAQLGAVQNRLEYTMRQLDNSSENISAAESRIKDADMGKEMMKLTKANILQQAGVAMLAQANTNPQSVLQLLR